MLNRPAPRFVRAITAAALLASAGTANAQLRIVTWNISNYNGGRVADIQTVCYGTNPANGLSMRPDIILAQEFVSASALAAFVSALNTAPGSPGDWDAASFIDGPDLDNVLVYRTGKVQYLGTTIVSTGGASPQPPRHTPRFDIRPAGYSAASTTLAMYNSHMKAQESGGDDDARRLLEAQRIRDNAQALPAGWNFLFGGDTNIQSSSVADYQEFVGSQANNLGRFFDPINRPGSWNNSATYAVLHTQDPSGSGGMDDRHDQLLIGASLIDGLGLDYIGNPAIPYSLSTWNDPNHSYRAWGNDGTSMNLMLRTTGNTMVGATIAQAIINAETAAGGHIPVFLDLKVPAKVTSSTTINFGQVPQGSPAAQALSVSHAGNTTLWTVAGLQNLSYSLAATSGFTAPVGSFSRTPGSSANSHTITMDTSTIGLKNGTITISSNDSDQPTRIVTLTGEVVGVNQPPVANAGPDQNLTDTDGNGSELVTLNGSASTDDAAVTNYRWDEGVTLLTQGASPTAGVSLSVGVHTITLTVSDSSLATDTDDVVITIDPPSCAADLDDGTGTGTPDGGTDINDLLYFLACFEAGGTCADLDDDGVDPQNPDGGADINDLLFFLAHFEQGC